MGLGRSAYNLLFRRTSTFLVTILFGAVVFERAFDQGADRLWGRMNKGKLWKDLQEKLEN
jgi:ubiquinol-cytochrome c reductase subunit 9